MQVQDSALANNKFIEEKMEKDFISNLFSIITAGMFYSLLFSSSEIQIS